MLTQLQTESPRGMRGESMKGKSKKSTYSTTFGIDPIMWSLPLTFMLASILIPRLLVAQKKTP